MEVPTFTQNICSMPKYLGRISRTRHDMSWTVTVRGLTSSCCASIDRVTRQILFFCVIVTARLSQLGSKNLVSLFFYQITGNKAT